MFDEEIVCGVVIRVGYGAFEKRTTFDKRREFEEYGYVTHECPSCGGECEPTEIDSFEAYCSGCDDTVAVETMDNE